MQEEKLITLTSLVVAVICATLGIMSIMLSANNDPAWLGITIGIFYAFWTWFFTVAALGDRRWWKRRFKSTVSCFRAYISTFQFDGFEKRRVG